MAGPTVSATGAAAVHKEGHIRGGSDALDADQLDVTYVPTGYTRNTSPAEVTDAEHLTSHLAGIDGFLAGFALYPVPRLVMNTADIDCEDTTLIDGMTYTSTLGDVDKWFWIMATPIFVGHGSNDVKYTVETTGSPVGGWFVSAVGGEAAFGAPVIEGLTTGVNEMRMLMGRIKFSAAGETVKIQFAKNTDVNGTATTLLEGSALFLMRQP